MNRILLVEDSLPFQKLVRSALGPGFDIVCAPNLAEASALIGKHSFDLILLDIVLPDGDGFDYCGRLRQSGLIGSTPVILLTAKSSVVDKVLGFSLGADDYIVKPFEALELKARVEAKGRKARGERASTFLTKGNLRIDISLHKAFMASVKGEKELDFTPIEFRLLSFLARNEGRVVTRDQILASVWGDRTEIMDRAIDRHICSVRQKLGEEGESIETIPTIGYRFLTGPGECGAS